MYPVYNQCGDAAREAGQKQKEAMYRKKSLEAGGAISKIFERNMIKAKQEEARKMEASEEMMERAV